MKVYVYSMRGFDELPDFERFCEKYQVEWAYTNETPCMENLDYAKGYDVVNIITTVIDKEMIDRWKALGVKCIATRTLAWTLLIMHMQKASAWVLFTLRILLPAWRIIRLC